MTTAEKILEKVRPKTIIDIHITTGEAIDMIRAAELEMRIKLIAEIRWLNTCMGSFSANIALSDEMRRYQSQLSELKRKYNIE